MLFDYCIGNPPYQQEVAIVDTKNGQKRSKSVFQLFQQEADKITANSLCLIYPAGRWIHQSGKGMKNFGLEQINDSRLSKIEFYPKSEEVFPNAAIGDGISIVVKTQKKTQPGFDFVFHDKDKEKHVFQQPPGEELLILDPDDASVMSKVSSFVKSHKLDYLHKKILSQKLFAIESDFVEKNPDKVRPLEANSVLASDEIKLFANDKAGKSGRATWYICKRASIPASQPLINEWQVVVSSANAGGQKRDNQLEVIDNCSAFGRARVALNTFKSYEEANNFFKYCQSKLVRFAFLMTDEALTSLGKRVPDLLDYKDNNGYIDYSKSIDNQVYRLFNLSEEDIQIVEEKITALDKKRGRL